MDKKLLVPSGISALRLGALPLFFYLYSLGNVAACLALLVFCVATDYFDGYYARKLSATSKIGAYFDATTDFTLMMGIFAFFTLEGLYPIWLVILISTAFVQFIITSVYAKKLYDPVGRYIGSTLYIGVVLTLLSPFEVILLSVQYAFVGFFFVSLVSRIWILTKNNG